jgi:hypothetical protein
MRLFVPEAWIEKRLRTIAFEAIDCPYTFSDARGAAADARLHP